MPSSREINKQNESLNEQRDLLADIEDIFEDVVSSAEDMTKNLEGVADLMKQILSDTNDIPDNVDDTNKNTNKFTQLLKKAKDKTKDLAKGLLQAGKQVADTMVSAFGEIGSILSSILSLSFVGAITGLFGAVISKFQYDMKAVVNEIGVGFEVAGNRANASFEKLVDSAERIGLSAKDIAQSSFELSNNFGMAFSESLNLSKDIADGAKALNVQSGTMATIVGQFQLIGDLSAEQSHVLSEQVGLLAAQHDVAPQAVLQDMAQSTEDMALFSKGGVKNFAKTAIEARKLGMSVKDVANSLKGMLNFEDSLNKELQASVMLGKNINLNEARRLAFAGDTAGAFQAIADELGDVDLGSLDPLTLQSVADAAGMSTEQLLKMSKGADEMGGVDMGEEALSAQDRAALQASKTMSNMEKILAKMNRTLIKLADLFGDDIIGALEKVANFIEKILTPEGFQEYMDKLKAAFTNFDWVGLGKKIGQMLLDGIAFILVNGTKLLFGMGKALGDSLVGGMLKGIGVMKIAMPKTFAKIATKLSNIFKGIRISWLKNVVKPIMNATRPFRKFFKEIKGSKGFAALSKAAKGFAKAIKFITKPITGLLKPFTSVFKVASKLFKPIVSLVKVFGKLGLRGIPILGQILSLIDGLFGGFNNVDKSLTGVTGTFKNMYRFVSGFVIGVIEGVVTAFTGLFDMIFGTDLTSWFKDAFQFIRDGFNTVTDAIVDFFADIPGSIANIFSGLGQLILDSIEGIGSIGKTILDLVVGGLSGLGEALMGVVSIGAEFFVDLFSGAIEGVKKVPQMIANAFLGIGSLVAGAVSGAFDSIGAMFSSIGESLMNLLPDIDFGEFAGDFAQSIKNALSTVTDFIKKPFNLIIRTFNRIKNAISDKVLFKGYTLMKKGFIVDNSVFGTIPPFNIGIPKIKTPSLMGDVPQLETGGTITRTGIAQVDKGEIVSGVRGQALKPVAEEVGKLKQDIAETNRLLMRILNDGIPVVKA